MKQLTLCTVILAVLVTCCDKSTGPIKNPVALEGQLTYFTAPPAIGGECDPSGLVLQDANWIQGKPDWSFSRVYVDDGDLDRFQGYHVRVEGTLDSTFAGGVETPRRKFPLIHVAGVVGIP